MGTKRSADAVDGDILVPKTHNERPSKKLRPFTDEDVKIAKIYENLASDEENTRINAAVDLIKTYSSLVDLSLVDEEEQATRLARLQKIDARLLRGLCSDRKSARVGFSLALTEILRLRFGARVGAGKGLVEELAVYLDFVKKYTRPDSGASAQEKKSHRIGRVFAYSSLIQSKVLSDGKDNGESLSLCIRAVCTVSQEVSWPWLREECGLVCYRAVQMLCDSKAEPSAVEQVLNVLQGNNSLRTPEGVVVWLDIKSKMPDAKLPDGIWHKNDPLHGKEVPELVKIMHAIKVDQEAKDGSGTRMTSPHFAWAIVFRELMRRDHKSATKGKNGAGKTGHFNQFWIEAVDNFFFAATASPERKALGFKIFESIISTGTGLALNTAFSPKLMKCLINQTAQAGRFLHVAAKGLLDGMIRRAHSDPGAAPAIFRALVSGSGDLNFDRLTKSNTVHSLLANADATALSGMLEVYLELIASGTTAKQQQVESYRQNIADQIVGLVRSRRVNEEDLESGLPKWLSKVFSTFIQCGYLAPGKGEDRVAFSPELSPKSQEMFRSRLISCLTHLMPPQPDDSSKLLPLTVSKLANHDIKDISTLSDADEDVQTSVTSAIKLFFTTNKVIEKDNERRERAFRTLLCTALLQAYGGEADALTMLTELLDCHDDLSSANPEAQAQAFNALFEVIMSFASQASTLNRKLSEQAFVALSPDMTEEAMQSLLDVLEQREGVAGQEALFGKEGEDEDVEESGSDDEDDDVEVVSQNSNEDENDTDSSSTSSADVEGSAQDSASSSTPSSPSSELLDFESKLATALRTSIPNNNDNDNDKDDSDAASTTSTTSTMSSNAMLALDSTLATIFRQRLGPSHPSSSSHNPTNHGTTTTEPTNPTKTSKKATVRAARLNVIHFKTRTLSLLSLFLKRHHSLPLSLSTIMPLLRLIRTTRAAQLAKAAGKTLCDVYFAQAKKTKGGLPRLPGSEGQGEMWGLLEECFAETRKWASKEHARCGSRAVLFLARCLMSIASCPSPSTPAPSTSTRPHPTDPPLPPSEKRNLAPQDWIKKINTLYSTAKAEEEDWEALSAWQREVWREWEVFRGQVGGGGGVGGEGIGTGVRGNGAVGGGGKGVGAGGEKGDAVVGGKKAVKRGRGKGKGKGRQKGKGKGNGNDKAKMNGRQKGKKENEKGTGT